MWYVTKLHKNQDGPFGRIVIVTENFRDLIDNIQEDPDVVDDMRKVFLHWLNETIDHAKRDNLVWEALHANGPI